MLRHTGLDGWQWALARSAGLVPPPDVHGSRWSAAVADALAARRDDIIAVTGSEAPVGGHRAAARLADRTGLAVDKADVEALADAGVLASVSWLAAWPLWDCRALDAVGADEAAAAVAERLAWIAASVSAQDAPAYLGWHCDEFTLAARSHGLRPGWIDRYAREDLKALAVGGPCGQAGPEHLLMTHQAAAMLGIGRAGYRYLTAAGLITPAARTPVQVARHWRVEVPLYRAADLQALRERPGTGWEVVLGADRFCEP